MCGIFGYVGEKRDAAEAVVEGLRRLDYRGYDSWGVAVVDGEEICVEKQVGIIRKDRPSLPESTVGIGHTRWATHGKVTVPNAHPHYSADKSFVLAQNGIAENADALRGELRKLGHAFSTETDTEVIVRLVEEKLKKDGSLEKAVRAAFRELEGRNTIIILTAGGDIVAARDGSPLVLGINEKSGDIYFSSDVFSFAPHVSRVLVLENGHMVVCRDGAFSVSDISSGKRVTPKLEKNMLKNATSDKGHFEHFMLKEIFEAPYVIRQVAAADDKEYLALAKAIKKAKHVYCIGSGTAGGAAAQMAFYLREYAGILAKDLIGAEANEYRVLIGKGDLLISPSQSGETADVLEVLEAVKKRGASIASFVNMPGSMMTRLSDHKFMANAGPEICVMSTKVYVSQVAWGYLVAKAAQGKLSEGKRALRALAAAIEKYLASEGNLHEIRALAAKLSKKEHIFLLGKGQNLQIIKEGMIKIVEGAYIHAHAIPAGDLKHYAITLMEEGTPVITAVSNDAVKAETLNATHQVSARGAHVLGIAPENHPGFADYLHVKDTGETSAIMNIVPLQLLAYYMAVTLKHNVDKPRNIAKSVTVK
jgi:glucosamine--fructose-6-phosphate aminotransferase (isomerizing)